MSDRRLTTSTAGLVLLAAALGGLDAHAQTAGLRVTTLATPKSVDTFRQTGRQTCGPTYSIMMARQPSTQPVGAIIGQKPAPGTPVSCGATVTVTQAGGPTKGGSNPTQSNTTQSNPTQAKPSPFTVGDLSIGDNRATLEQRSRGLCGAPAVIQTLPTPSTKLAGAFVKQDPPPQTEYVCGMRVIVWIAAPPTPPPPRPIYVADLSLPGAVARFTAVVREGCDGEAPPLKLVQLPSTQPKGAYLSQDPQANTLYTCGQTVVIDTSLGPPPKAQQQPKPQPQPQPEPVPRPRPEPLPRFVEVPELSTPQAVEDFKSDVQQACRAPPPVQDKVVDQGLVSGPYAGQDPAEETVYTCGEPVTVWHAALDAWLLVAGGAGVVLAGGGTLAWRRLHPKVGLRAGAPQVSAAPKGPVPRVDLHVDGGPPRAVVRGDLPILNPDGRAR